MTVNKKALEVDSDGDVLCDGLNDDFDFQTAAAFLQTDLQLQSKSQSSKRSKREHGRFGHEKMARSWSEQVEDGSGRLMVRDGKTGKWTAPAVEADQEPQEGSEAEDASPPAHAPETQPPASTKSFRQWSSELSELAASITERPEDNYSSLKRLPEFFKSTDPQRRTIGVASTVAIFKDILPMYPVRELGDAEKAVQVSKEVQSNRNYEHALLSNYTEFVMHCKAAVSTKGDLLALKALCELCKASSVRSFNHFESILTFLANAAAGNRCRKVRVAGCKVIKYLLSEVEDASGRLTMLTLKAISGRLRGLSYAVKDKDMFEALECARLRSQEAISVRPDAPMATPKTQSHLSKRERKKQKEEKKEARKKAIEESSEIKKQQQKWARESRESLFTILFGFLKSQSSSPLLLVACMSAVSKFTPFMGIEYFADLTNIIKSLAVRFKASPDMSLFCIVAVFRMANALEAASSLDLKFFYDLYYAALRHPDQLAAHLDTSKEVFALLFKSKRIIPKERAAAFAHRIYSAALQATGEARSYFGEQLYDLFSGYPSIRDGLLDDEPLGNGTFLDTCDDPDMCKPFCKSIDLKALASDPRCGHLIKKILK